MVSFFIILVHLLFTNLQAIKSSKNGLIQLKAALFISIIIYNTYYISIRNYFELKTIQSNAYTIKVISFAQFLVKSFSILTYTFKILSGKVVVILTSTLVQAAFIHPVSLLVGLLLQYLGAIIIRAQLSIIVVQYLKYYNLKLPLIKAVII